MRRRPSITNRTAWLGVAALVVGMAVLQAAPAQWHALLRHDRAAVLGGQLWRLFTAHLVHLGWAHWALNVAGLVLCATLADPPPRPKTLLAYVIALGLGVSVMLLLFDPRLSHYAGLSGVLYGLFVLVLWPQARRGDPLAVAALCTVLGWMAWQLVMGPPTSEAALIGGPIVAHAHAYGVASAFGLLWLRHRRRRQE